MLLYWYWLIYISQPIYRSKPYNTLTFKGSDNIKINKLGLSYTKFSSSLGELIRNCIIYNECFIAEESWPERRFFQLTDVWAASLKTTLLDVFVAWLY